MDADRDGIRQGLLTTNPRQIRNVEGPFEHDAKADEYASLVADGRVRDVVTCCQAVLMSGVYVFGNDHAVWMAIFIGMVVFGMIWTIVSHIVERSLGIRRCIWGELGVYVTYLATVGMLVLLAVHANTKKAP